MLPKDRRPRPKRWADGVGQLRTLQTEYEGVALPEVPGPNHGGSIVSPGFTARRHSRRRWRLNSLVCRKGLFQTSSTVRSDKVEVRPEPRSLRRRPRSAAMSTCRWSIRTVRNGSSGSGRSPSVAVPRPVPGGPRSRGPGRCRTSRMSGRASSVSRAAGSSVPWLSAAHDPANRSGVSRVHVAGPAGPCPGSPRSARTRSRPPVPHAYGDGNCPPSSSCTTTDLGFSFRHQSEGVGSDLNFLICRRIPLRRRPGGSVAPEPRGVHRASTAAGPRRPP